MGFITYVLCVCVFCRYDVYDVEMIPKDCYIIPGEIINDPRYSFVTIDMYEVLFEGGRSIRYSIHALYL